MSTKISEHGNWVVHEYILQKWLPEMVQTYNVKKNMKVMVWGAFWDDGRSNLYIMDRDFESAKHGYSAESYLEVLDGEVAGIFENLDPGYEFMQDNASIHTAYKVRDWFAEKAIRILKNWPPHSPDLNPIEHIWWHLKVGSMRCSLMWQQINPTQNMHARD